MWLEKIKPWQVVALAGLVRAALICWAEYQDQHLPVKYTDIDYVVFTDAARFVAAGGSPYQRATYRYSPLLAYLLLPNIWLHPAWGKIMFSLSDLAAAGLLHALLRRTGAPRPLRAGALLLWLFNPYTATISTRGSCDVLSVLLLLGLLLCLLYGMPAAAGALYGIAVHFRIYPVIYGPAIALYLVRRALALLPENPGGPSPGNEADDADNDPVDDAADPTTTESGPRAAELAAAAAPPPPPLLGAIAAGNELRHRRRGSSSAATAASCPAEGVGSGDGGGGAAAAADAAEKPEEDEPRRGSGSGRRERRGEARGAAWRRPQGPGSLTAAAAAAAVALRPAVLFGVCAAASFGLLGALFYKLYGNEFLQEAFLHHLTRKDPRHNFSPYYYPVYLSYGSSSSSSTAAPDVHCGHAACGGGGGGGAAANLLRAGWHAVRRVVPLDEPWRLAMLPQGAALLALAVRFHEDLPSAWLLQTWSFVALNKVVTAQYFVWYLSLLPLALPALAAQRAVPRWALAAGGGGWVAAQLHWLAWAYQLEMRGRSVHLPLWVGGLVFQAANTALLVLLVRALLWGLRRERGGGGGAAAAAAEVAASAKGDGAGGAAAGTTMTFLEASLVLARTPPLSAMSVAGRKKR